MRLAFIGNQSQSDRDNRFFGPIISLIDSIIISSVKKKDLLITVVKKLSS